MPSALLFWWMRVNDMSKKEQISVILRYFQPESGEVHEEFIISLPQMDWMQTLC